MTVLVPTPSRTKTLDDAVSVYKTPRFLCSYGSIAWTKHGRASGDLEAAEDRLALQAAVTQGERRFWLVHAPLLGVVAVFGLFMLGVLVFLSWIGRGQV